MKGVDYSRIIYSSVDSIARNILEVSEDEMEEILEGQFDMDFYPLETDPNHELEGNSANKYMRAGFNISSLLAEGYSDSDGVFFDKRSNDFHGFSQELGDYGSGFKANHLIQYANLYSEIAEQESLDINDPSSTIVLQDLEMKRDTVQEFLSEIERKLSTEIRV